MINVKGRIKAGKGTLIGNSGEHYVMAELLKREIVAALAPRNAPSFDILAAKENRTVRIRVKTKSQIYQVWQWVAKKDGNIFRDLSEYGDFVVLVDLAMDIKDLKFYVVPTSQIDRWLTEDFNKWAETPGKNKRHDPKNKKRNLDQRMHTQELSKFDNRWEDLFRDNGV